ncbi:NAD(P)-dependent oxidoreductase, partial [Methylobacterium radiotolerans]
VVAISYLEVVQDNAENTQAWVEHADRLCLLLAGNITYAAQHSTLVERTVNAFGRLSTEQPVAAQS